ncbi:hypothetical protein FOXG_22905 [Fusarium oxysporum f. sp. lycopersici 4287]|uniref:Uncharacterized protein n=1 Tax=Fusarium oxysporum f. sp. lycopersici (strain 4287 / CBS 123668 / FGSC 9935 / NRRL 34936) TaxID=426428 RepID=A0A0J9WCV3_FUSO4|nr:uncharacterized protein FOXG_22905 [Fusarium oxysporum f. sp. lycopersici 4287]XP_018258754.1 uncharacterized protein FOXG_22905 [Fusarium oxysporum f. sp. lycopersici 4287]KNB20708.1 hypothetical protein FOXG_22905 [Fusarium oxysporum f. sp. lycopersici 4287]KNB20709.1 hypothetical protein FOXG_22905 [Fusarium oxysporum f. sp. lycopersici 4287]
MTPKPDHSRNRFTLRQVKDACRYSENVTYSSAVIFFVFSSARRSLSRVASLDSACRSSSSSPPGRCSERRNRISHGRITAGNPVFLVVASGGMGPLPAFSVTASAIASSDEPLSSSSRTDLRMLFQRRKF